MTVSPILPAEMAEKVTQNSITFRLATPADDAWIEQLHAFSFGPGRFSRAAFRVRERFSIDPTLSLIAEVKGTPVSSVSMTPISLSGVDGYLLGPLVTDPSYRGKGAGRLLVYEVSQMALRRDEGCFVLLVGDLPYYEPLGFVASALGTIVFPGPVDPSRVLVFSLNADQGEGVHGTIAAFGAR